MKLHFKLSKTSGRLYLSTKYIAFFGSRWIIDTFVNLFYFDFFFLLFFKKTINLSSLKNYISLFHRPNFKRYFFIPFFISVRMFLHLDDIICSFLLSCFCKIYASYCMHFVCLPFIFILRKQLLYLQAKCTLSMVLVLRSSPAGPGLPFCQRQVKQQQAPSLAHARSLARLQALGWVRWQNYKQIILTKLNWLVFFQQHYIARI